MSDKINDGGPAFPVVGEGVGNPLYHVEGLTKLDYFAAAAMQVGAYQQFAVALVKAMRPDEQTVVLKLDASITAATAYEIAYAMLRASEAKP